MTVETPPPAPTGVGWRVMRIDARRGLVIVSVCGLVATLGACPSGSSSSPSGAGTSVFLNVLPPGSDGNSGDSVGTSPPIHFQDQLALYGDLSYAKPGLLSTPCKPPVKASEHTTASALACNYFKDAGLTPEVVTSTETLTARSGGKVTVQRDAWGVPFISAATRTDAMYGFGYASAEDRLFLFDLVRNLGRGRLSEFLGPAAAIFAYDTNLAAVAGYDDTELTQMIAEAQAKFGQLGRLSAADIAADVDGLNDYIDSLSRANKAKVPSEYGLLKGGILPAHFVPEDLIASELVVESLFASGGGGENENELLLQELDPTFGAGSVTVSAAACQLWRDLRHADDPDTPRTIDAAFSQSPAKLDETCPRALRPGAAIWDVGSFTPVVTVSTAVATPASVTSPRTILIPVGQNPRRAARDALSRLGFAMPNGMSNFIAVTASQTHDGHPIAVMGPQTGYFAPELLWEVAMHSGGGTPFDFDGRGIAFLLPYIQIGHGADYAWSATSGESDIVDVRVSKMCNLNGSAPSRADANGDGFPDSDGYTYDAGDGQGPLCRRFYEHTDTWTATPTAASMSAGGPSVPQAVTRHVLRTHYGPVFATATVGGVPVAVSLQRSTFHAEVYTSAPFAFAASHVVKDAASFQRLFNGCTGTFNWLYVDAKDVGYIHAGLYPVRDPGQDPDLPVWGDGRFEWASDRHLPATYFSNYGGAQPYPGRVTPVVQNPQQGFVEWQDFMPFAQHPQAINPQKGWIASWNNAPARGWWAADNQGWWGAAHRVDMLGKRVAAFQSTGKKFDLGNMVEIMADAGFTDLRGQEVLPLLIQLMKKGALNPEQTQVVAMMQQWIDSGSSSWIGSPPGFGAWRRDRNHDGIYDQRAQVVLMDAWYPHLIDRLLPQVTAIDGGVTGNNPTTCSGIALQCRYDAPRSQGSAFEFGYFQIMKRVLEMALATPGHTDYRALRCAGTGAESDCRNAALAALDQALTDLGGFGARASWDGSTLANAQTGAAGQTVETYDEISHTSFGVLSAPPIRWINRPTFQQVVEVQ
jgi:acyl-homoserine lactone acylase PvdQ